MSAVITQRLVDLARALQREGKGRRTALCQAAAQELGLSLATIYRKLEEVSVATTTRKRRSDAGSSDLTREEALTISAALMESARHNEKRLYSLGDAVDALRASGMIRAEAVDKGTGELRPMSLSAIGRALRSYKLHPDQLLAPAPVTELASLHPNHVWQIDASLCVLYYLKPGPEAIQAYMAKHYPNLGTAKMKRRKLKARDEVASEAGYRAGKEAQLHHGIGSKPVLRLSQGV